MAGDVGFQFSGDVVGGASLVHAATGRLLKALSDGGVDFYAVSAAVQLGKLISIEQSQELAVTRAIANKRQSISSVFSTALRIGWGHRSVAVELARTRAGASALMLTGILRTGSDSWTAASALSELMRLHGCTSDQLPTIDSLRGMILYLSPFVHDIGFEAVHQLVTTTCRRVCGREGLEEHTALFCTGKPTEWPRYIKHLISTAEACEDAHLEPSQRIAWLAAYASFGLKMSVKIFHENHVMWECAGTRGSVTFYTASHSGQEIVNKGANKLPLQIESALTNTSTWANILPIQYPLENAFDEEFSLVDATFKIKNGQLREQVRSAIATFAISVVDGESAMLSPSQHITREIKRHPFNGHFPAKREWLGRVLTDMGIINNSRTILTMSTQVYQSRYTNIQVDQSRYMDKIDEPRDMWNPEQLNNDKDKLMLYGLRCLDNEAADFIERSCGQAGIPVAHYDSKKCSCIRVATLIAGFASAALALMQCTYEPSELKLSQQTLRMYDAIGWVCGICTSPEAPLRDEIDGHVLEYLARLVCPFMSDADMPQHNVKDASAISAHNMTVYYRGLVENDCFDTSGRTIALRSGKISFQGCLRAACLEWRKQPGKTRTWPFSCEGNSFSDGTVVRPLWATGSNTIHLGFTLDSSVIHAHLAVGHDDEETLFPTSVRDCVTAVLSCPLIGRQCGHESDAEYRIPFNGSAVTGYPVGLPEGLRKQCGPHTIFFTKGSQLAQAMQIRLLSVTGGERKDILQGDSCLECLIKKYPDHWIVTN